MIFEFYPLEIRYWGLRVLREVLPFATDFILNMIKRWLQFLLGFNGASVIRGLRLGFSEFILACFASLDAAHPRQNRVQNQVERELEEIPEIALGDILGSRKVAIKLNVQKYEDGILPVHEALALLSILAAENPREVLEIGTFMGHTTRALAENLPDGIIHTVDLPTDFSSGQDSKGGPPKDDFHLIRRRVVGREFKDQAVAQRIRQHFGDSAVIDFREFGQPSFFYVDGSHTYEYCKQDSEKSYELCGGKGTFLWHDCDNSHPGVVRFVSEWRSLGRNIVRIKGTALAYWKNT
jgi:hypothetical protein